MGCNKVKQLANISVPVSYTQTLTIPQIPGDTAGVTLPPGGASLPFPSIPVVTNSKQYIATYHTSADKIVSFDMTSMQVQIVSPAGQTFDFLDSIQIFISSKNYPEEIVSYKYGVPKGQTTLNMDVTPGLNLKNYFIQDTMYFRVNTHVNAVPASGTKLNIISGFTLVANPLN